MYELAITASNINAATTTEKIAVKGPASRRLRAGGTVANQRFTIEMELIQKNRHYSGR